MASSACLPADQLLGDPELLDAALGLLLREAELDQLAEVPGLGLVVRQLGVDGVELDQRLVGTDPVAHVVQDLEDPPRLAWSRR